MRKATPLNFNTCKPLSKDEALCTKSVEQKNENMEPSGFSQKRCSENNVPPQGKACSPQVQPNPSQSSFSASFNVNRCSQNLSKIRLEVAVAFRAPVGKPKCCVKPANSFSQAPRILIKSANLESKGAIGRKAPVTLQQGPADMYCIEST